MRCRRRTARWRGGSVAGRPITAPPLAHAGWVIVAAAGDLIAIRAADGVVLWRKPLGPIEFRPALDGDLLVASLVDGRLVGAGSQRRVRALDRRIFVRRRASRSRSAARVYVGTQDKMFYALIAASGRIEDHPPDRRVRSAAGSPWTTSACTWPDWTTCCGWFDGTAARCSGRSRWSIAPRPGRS